MPNWDRDRFIQAEAGADLLDLFGRGAVAGDHRRRIAGR